MPLFLFPALSALLTAIAFSVDGAQLLVIVSLIPLIFALVESKSSAFCVFNFTFFFYAIIMLWLFELYPMTNFGISKEYSLIFICLGIVVSAVFQGIIMSLPFFLTKLTFAWTGKSLFIFSLLFISAEATISFVGSISFPWGRLGTILAPSPLLIQSASIFGALGVSFFILLVNCFLASALFTQSRRSLLLAIALVLGNISLGWLMMRDSSVETEEPITAAVVQGGFSSLEKWTVTPEETIDQYLDLAQQAANLDAQIIALPETAIPIKLLNDYKLKSKFVDFAKANEVSIIVGTFDDAVDGARYNSLFTFNANGTISQPVYKQKLVPFGEFIPFEEVFKFFAPDLAFDVAAGMKSVVMETPTAQIGGIICYESIFPDLVGELKQKGAQLLVISSNDSWLGDSSALYQHHSHAIMRAVESDTWVLRAGNTGISSIINSNGEVVNSIMPFKADIAVSDIYLSDNITFYNIFGDIIAFPGFLLTFYFLFNRIRNKMKNFETRSKI